MSTDYQMPWNPGISSHDADQFPSEYFDYMTGREGFKFWDLLSLIQEV